MLLFKDTESKYSLRTLIIDGINLYPGAPGSHLGHSVFTNDKDSIAASTKDSFWSSFNLLGLLLGLFILS